MSTVKDRVLQAFEAVRARRKAIGKETSFRSLEEEYELPHAAIQKLAKGERAAPRPENARRIAVALETTPAWLFEGIGPAESHAPPPARLASSLDDRYPSRAQAIALASKWASDEAVAAVKLEALDADEDPGVEFWLKTIKRLDRLGKAYAGEGVALDPDDEAPRPIPKGR